MSRTTLIHRDLSRRIESLKQIVEASKPHSAMTSTTSAKRATNVGDMYSIDLNPNTNQLILKYTKRSQPTRATFPNNNPPLKSVASNSICLDEGFESDVDTISLVSTESTISKSQETDSANGSSDSDDSDVSKNYNKKEETIVEQEVIEHLNLVNCVCYTDDIHPDILILVANDETLVFRFDDARELETFHENFSTIKAVASQKCYQSQVHKHFNLLQRTDADGMTHIRISRTDDNDSYAYDNDEFTSLISLPNFPIEKPVTRDFATLGKPVRKARLKKSQSIEDFLQDDKPLRKIWNSAENILESHAKPKVPPRRKKGPAPQPPAKPAQTNLSRTYSQFHAGAMRDVDLQMGNVFHGQFVRVQVEPTHREPPVERFVFSKMKHMPEILKYEVNSDNYRSSTMRNPNRQKKFEAFKFSDPKNLMGYAEHRYQPEIRTKPKSNLNLSFNLNLGLYIPKYKSKTKTNQMPTPAHAAPAPSTFTNRLFGMSSKLKEFSSSQSSCNPNRRYETSNLKPSQNKIASDKNNFMGKLGRFGRSGSLGNLTLLAEAEKHNANCSSNSNTLKSVIKKGKRDDTLLSTGKREKKVTFSAYNTVQVV